MYVCVRVHVRALVWVCVCACAHAAIGGQRRRSPGALASDVFDPHLGSHILQVCSEALKRRGLPDVSIVHVERAPTSRSPIDLPVLRLN